jgi:hypothetical protein
MCFWLLKRIWAFGSSNPLLLAPQTIWAGATADAAVPAVDLRATLPGSSDYKLSKMRGVSVRPLTALGPGALGKAAHRHFPQPFYFFKKNDYNAPPVPTYPTL